MNSVPLGVFPFIYRTGLLVVRRVAHGARTPSTRLQHHEPAACGIGGKPADRTWFGRSARRRGFDRLKGLWRLRMACGEISACGPPVHSALGYWHYGYLIAPCDLCDLIARRRRAMN